MTFNDLKEFNGEKYSGMPIGGGHEWNYLNAKWKEKKVSPCEWAIQFSATKKRVLPAPPKSGVDIGTLYHWFIIAHQKVVKVDKDSYGTVLTGAKIKIGHRRPYWRDWSYNYPNNTSMRQRIINALEANLDRLKEDEDYDVYIRELNMDQTKLDSVLIRPFEHLTV